LKRLLIEKCAPNIWVHSSLSVGTNIIAELGGSVFHHAIAAFRVILYFACSKITVPPLSELLDISQHCLQELEESDSADLDNELEDGDDFLSDD
jgi:hypothetical protein